MMNGPSRYKGVRASGMKEELALSLQQKQLVNNFFPKMKKRK
jgi:hypothetical protein